MQDVTFFPSIYFSNGGNHENNSAKTANDSLPTCLRVCLFLMSVHPFCMFCCCRHAAWLPLCGLSIELLRLSYMLCPFNRRDSIVWPSARWLPLKWDARVVGNRDFPKLMIAIDCDAAIYTYLEGFYQSLHRPICSLDPNVWKTEKELRDLWKNATTEKTLQDGYLAKRTEFCKLIKYSRR